MTITGKVEAIMMTESAYYKYVYRDLGCGRYAPEQVEITSGEYYRLLNDSPKRYVEPGYIAFEIGAQITTQDSDEASDHREWLESLDDPLPAGDGSQPPDWDDYKEWCDEQDSQDAERPGLW